ncbi:bifunctional diguanylate cyclase/phosphodiesterase [Oryzifoliimicrobium ureilyticus]|uniref:bifunctional diguanylate cyclase/phosphodiesterase n=1 Tax=Oryzifoliimicrobium ureilyticus TaxID=3113724 RepID=UPI00307637B5
MFETLSLLIGTHAPWFVVAAVFICLIGACLVSDLKHSYSHLGRPYRYLWLIGIALTAGLSVWTTHFIAILGYRPDFVLGFDGPITLMSAVVAITAVGIPLALSVIRPGLIWRAGLGAIGGFGIGAMHQTGMLAITGCVVRTSAGTNIFALLMGAFFLSLSCLVQRTKLSKILSPLCFALAVSSTHFGALLGTYMFHTHAFASGADEHLLLTVFTGAGAAILFLGAIAVMAMARNLESKQKAHSIALSTALDNMSNGLIMIDRRNCLALFNKRFMEMNRLGRGDIWIGMSVDRLLDALHRSARWSPEHRQKAEQSLQRWLTLADGDTDEFIAGDGRVIEVNSRTTEVRSGVVVTFDDISREREAQKRIADLVYIDPLTKLGNRRALQRQMQEDFDPKKRFKLVLIDLDGFKSVNDTYGHHVGDQILFEAGQRIVVTSGVNGLVARLGGDELAVLVYGDFDQSMDVATRILAAVNDPFVVDNQMISIGCSIGICCSDDTIDVQHVMQQADIALYEAKRSGGAKICIYKPGMLEAVAERQRLSDDMRQAIDRGQLHLVYQPVYAFSRDCIIGYEALLRWQHPEKGPISPDIFIPLAEENGQIFEMGKWVLEEACREAASWPNDRYVAVNVSATQLRSPLLLAHLTGALAKSGLLPHRLEIELTETAMVTDRKMICGIFHSLRQLGITVALDDFGTGYSSLAHLKDFSFDRIKIDRSFVASAEADPQALAVLRAIAQIGKELKISILSEGVETDSQLALVRAVGCDTVQGYLIGRPDRLVAEEKRLTA